MRDFRELLEEQNKDTYFARMYKRLNIGNYELSVQASEKHYCIPRKTLSDVFEYENMEVAVLTKSGEWCDIEHDSFFNDWEFRDVFLCEYDGMVAGYVPIIIIQSLCDYIENKSKCM